MNLAKKPVSYFVVPSKLLLGANNIERVTTEAGVKVGSIVPQADNFGLLIPLQTGFPDTDAVDRTMRLLNAGSARDAEWIQRPLADLDTEFLGVDDPRQFWGFHATSDQTAIASDNIAMVYASKFRRQVVANIDDTVNPPVVGIQYRNIDTDAYDEWTTASFTLKELVPTSDKNNCRMVELRDGTIAMAVLIQYSSAGGNLALDFDIYHSADGGKTFTRVAARVFIKTNPPFSIDVVDQFSFAVAGDWLRITYTESSGDLGTIVSSDRGITWAFAANVSTITIGDNLSTTNPGPHSVVGVDDEGGFLLVFLDGANNAFHASARGAGGWTNIASSAQSPPIGTFSCFFQARAMGWIWEWHTWLDTAGGAAGWSIQRRRPEDALESFIVGPAWEIMEPMSDEPGRVHTPSRGQAIWAGDRFSLVWANRTGAGAEINLMSLCYALGWNDRSIGIVQLIDDLNSASDVGSAGAYVPMWREAWYPTRGVPGIALGSLWTTSATGTPGTIAVNMDRIRYQTFANGDTAYSEFIVASGTEQWGGNATGVGRFEGSCIRGVFRLGENPSSSVHTSSNVGVECRFANGSAGAATGHRHFEVRIGAGTIRIRDLLAAADVADLTGDFDNGKYWEIRIWSGIGAGFNIAVAVRELNPAAGPQAAWTSTGTVVVTSGGVLDNRVRWGNIAHNVGAVTVTSDWREFDVNGIDQLRQSGQPSNKPGERVGSAGFPDFTNPIDLLGMASAEGEPVEVGGQVSVEVTGAGGAEEDQFDLELDHVFAAERVFEDSPRIEYRSTGLPANLVGSGQESIYDAGGWTLGPGAGDTVVVFGTTTDPFGVAANAQVLEFNSTSAFTPRIFMRFATTLTEGAVYVVSFWANYISEVGQSDGNGISVDFGDGADATEQEGKDLNGVATGWQKFEFVGVAGPSGFLDINLTSWVGVTPPNLSRIAFFDVKWTKAEEVVFRIDSAASLQESLDTVALFNTNTRRMRFEMSVLADFIAPLLSVDVDTARFGTKATQLPIASVNNKRIEVTVSGADESIIDREAEEFYVRAVDGLASQLSHLISRQSIASHWHLDNLSGTASAEGYAAADDVVIFGVDSVTEFASVPGATYIRVVFIDQQTEEGYYRIGHATIGRRVNIDVPLDWAFTDNEQPNVTHFRSRGAVTWAYEEAPEQRSIQGRLVGDVSQRQRDLLRFALQSVSYEVLPITLVLDEDRPNASNLHGRIVSGSQQDNSAWYRDTKSDKRTAGDQSIQFEEVV